MVAGRAAHVPLLKYGKVIVPSLVLAATSGPALALLTVAKELVKLSLAHSDQ